MRKRLQFVVILIGCLISTGYSQNETRKIIHIPDVLGYRTLKCDLHTHTVFSDGNVWPTVRVQEAFQEGLDVIAITDHLEYTPHEKDLPENINRPYEIAKPVADAAGILLIPGAEITRAMPPGHFNAIFLSDARLLDTEKVEDAFAAAAKQKAFVFWNHPGWRQPNNVGIWYDEHTNLLQQKMFQGIEIVNGNDYYPEAHQWCIEKNLTMIANSDVHDPILFDYDYQNGKHRPMTLVFAKEATLEGIREALIQGRTTAFWNNTLAGPETFLSAIFSACCSLKTDGPITLKGKTPAVLQIENTSDLAFELERIEEDALLQIPAQIKVPAGSIAAFQIRAKEPLNSLKDVELAYRVTNLYAKPNEGLPIFLKLRIQFSS